MCFFTARRNSQEAVVICTRVVKVDVNFIVFKNLGAKPACVTVFAPAAFSRRRGTRRRNRRLQGAWLSPEVAVCQSG